MTTVNLKDHSTFYGSDELVKELQSKMQPEDVVINFAYTDYGGDFFDKVAIQFFTEKHPDSIVSESTSWSGENAFIFGPVAKEFQEETERYLLGFNGIEDYYSIKQSEQETEDFKRFLDDLDKDKYQVTENSLEKLLNERSGYYSITTQGVDYSERDLIKFCLENDIISIIEDESNL